MAVVVLTVCLVATVNLVLTVGIVRRLREHTTELAALRGRAGPAPLGDTEVTHPVGTPVGPFEASGVDDRRVSLPELGPSRLIAFLSPHCAPCSEQLPHVIDHARASTDTVVAVVVGSPADTAAVVDRLRPVATVVVEEDQGPVQRAFGVTGFPAFVRVENGTIAASDFILARVADETVAVGA